MLRLIAGAACACAIAGCLGERDPGSTAPPPDASCRCEGAVPEGTLSVACGASQCVGGVAGYRCTGPNAAIAEPEACAAPSDGGVIGCDCDASSECDAGCPCDEDCVVACACDASSACESGCSCDPDCHGSGCPDWTAGDGTCDCGCGSPDSDCPSALSPDDCVYSWCADDQRVDPADPTQCTALPAGWTCPGSWLDNDYCDCGCGIRDEECDAGFTVRDCLVPNGCAEGTRPDPSDPTQCITNPVGWTCNGLLYGDGRCHCGCGATDPDCPTPLRFTACSSVDGCPSGEGPSPMDPTQCIANPPQDDWTCDLALLYDRAQCDCGCGAIDPDCGSGATASSCDSVHCTTREELDPASIGRCVERCAPATGTVGHATCTNGGSVVIGGSCAMSLSRCTDFHSYEVECSGSSCVCRVDGSCVTRASGFCGSVASTLNTVCGWSLIDDR